MSSLTAVTQSPFDIAGITKAIDAALGTLKPEEHGALVINVMQDQASATLIARGPQFGPFKSSILGTVTKPKAGPLGWQLSGRVSFAMSPAPLWFAAFRGWYRVLRAWNSKPLAAWKAWKLCNGREVKLIG